MCVIFFYACSNPNPGGYKLILASNRDEFFARNTKDAAPWSSSSHVYGGIDLETGREGGTWLALGGHDGVFKVGALLNLTGEPKPRNVVENMHHHQNTNTCQQSSHSTSFTSTLNKHSTENQQNNNLLLGRGMIVSDFVASKNKCTLEDYNRDLVADCSKYNAFNFVSIEIGDRSTPAKICMCSNVPANLTYFKEGECYGFGNSLPSTPFQKVINGREKFRQIVEQFNEHLETIETAATAETQLILELQNLLKCREKYWPDPELKRRAPNWGEHLSALNVNVPEEDYGSRTHTVILVDGNNKMHFYEETMVGLNPQGEWRKTHLQKPFFKE